MNFSAHFFVTTIFSVFVTFLLFVLILTSNVSTAHAQAASAFYVSPSGSDTNPGTLAAPFATLTKAQTAMRASATKTVYVRAGSYTLPTINNCGDGEACGLKLTSADAGETWSYYAPDGVNSASITGGSTSANNGLYYVIFVDNGANNITIDGLAIHNFKYAAIGSMGGANNLMIRNNNLYNQFYVPGDNSNPGAISLYGTSNTTISHNVIHDAASWGIDVVNVNGNVSNLLVDGNVVYNTCTVQDDCSAIYIFDPAGTATNIRWTNNFVRDGNMHAPLNTGAGSALYADDCASNITMSGNVLTGRNGSNSIHIHGGNNNRITGNLTDLTTKQGIATFQTADGSGCSQGTMSGNTYQNNIIISSGGGGGYFLLSGSPKNPPVIKNNNYYNYGGTAIDTSDDYSDSAPVSVNPQISGWPYTIAAGSPVFSAPISFPGLVGGWGPPGYVIPQNTAPSSPISGGSNTTTDTQAPTAPSNFTASVISSTQINLSWAASTDSVGVSGYKVSRAGAQIATQSGTSYSDTGLTAGTAYSYTVAAYDAAGNTSNVATVSATTQAQTQTTSAPTVSFSANLSSLTSGGSATLTWSSTNATACTGSGDWNGSKTASGSQTLSNITSAKTYTLTCTGAGGSANKSVTVNVTSANSTTPAPSISISANPTSVASGNSSTLAWSAANATSCTASGDWEGTKTTTGSQTVSTITSSKTYTLTCTGTSGSTNASVTVTVSASTVPTPVVTLSANPPSVASGGQVTLSWTSTNAAACTASGNWNGSKALSGSEIINSVTYSGTYVLTCTGSGGTVSASAPVTVINTSPVPAPNTSYNKFVVTNRVVTTDAVKVRPSPTDLLLVAASQRLGAVGTVVEGPVSFAGIVRWKIDFDSGADGWVAEDYIRKESTSSAPSNADIQAQIAALYQLLNQLIATIAALKAAQH